MTVLMFIIWSKPSQNISNNILLSKLPDNEDYNKIKALSKNEYKKGGKKDNRNDYDIKIPNDKSLHVITIYK